MTKVEIASIAAMMAVLTSVVFVIFYIITKPILFLIKMNNAIVAGLSVMLLGILITCCGVLYECLKK